MRILKGGMVKIVNIRQHLLNRDVNFDEDCVYINEKLNTATFLLWNLSKQLIGYQHYNPGGPKGKRANTKDVDVRDLKYQSRITKIGTTPMLAVYGLETYDPKSEYLFVVEGIFDAIKLHRLGLPAIAVIANDPIHLREWLSTLPQKIIVISDRDENEAGNKLLSYGDLSYTVPAPFGDLGDMELVDVYAFVRDMEI